tara:strand:- start:1 stop:822 length:822 start_codon:yes stop_codon:yes gene_type:complete
MAFKMKGNPMQRNFGIGSPLHKGETSTWDKIKSAASAVTSNLGKVNSVSDSLSDKISRSYKKNKKQYRAEQAKEASGAKMKSPAKATLPAVTVSGEKTETSKEKFARTKKESEGEDGGKSLTKNYGGKWTKSKSKQGVDTWYNESGSTAKQVALAESRKHNADKAAYKKENTTKSPAKQGMNWSPKIEKEMKAEIPVLGETKIQKDRREKLQRKPGESKYQTDVRRSKESKAKHKKLMKRVSEGGVKKKKSPAKCPLLALAGPIMGMMGKKKE